MPRAPLAPSVQVRPAKEGRQFEFLLHGEPHEALRVAQQPHESHRVVHEESRLELRWDGGARGTEGYSDSRTHNAIVIPMTRSDFSS